MRTFLVVLLLGSIALNVYLFSTRADGYGVACGPDVVPTYGSISFTELTNGHTQFIKEKANLPGTTRTVWLSFEDLQNYMCVVRKGAETNNLPLENLGIRVYFTKSAGTEGTENLAFVPSNLQGGSPQDWPESVLTQNVPGSERSYIMNKMRPCPVNCGRLALNVR
ncbi:MAG: hypothetical protein EOP54_08375 [Sphingobacteriales bacterium]|nr:MAG: hypothetical protein EOP54_08375 [Sphingobacteriales bacterium]